MVSFQINMFYKINLKILFIKASPASINDSNSIARVIVGLLDTLTKFVDSNCANLKPWQIVLYSSSASLASFYLYNFYHDIDTGMSGILTDSNF